MVYIMTEKRKPSYDLEAFKKAFRTVERLRITEVAFLDAVALGFDKPEIIKIIQTMQRAHFYKSMTSYRDYRVWQDVYHVPSKAGLLYVKFTAHVLTEFLLLSFKEKDNE